MQDEVWEPLPNETAILTLYRQFDAILLLLNATSESAWMHKQLHEDLTDVIDLMIVRQPTSVLDLAAQTVALMCCGKLPHSSSEMSRCSQMLGDYIRDQRERADSAMQTHGPEIWSHLLPCIVLPVEVAA